jgi:hypothetical protein
MENICHGPEAENFILPQTFIWRNQISTYRYYKEIQMTKHMENISSEEWVETREGRTNACASVFIPTNF